MMSAAAHRRFRLGLIAALLYGTGAHWILVQGAAWAGMVAARSRRAGVAQALVTTFDGRHPCRACLIVRRGSDRDASPRAAAPVLGVDFALTTAVPFIVSAQRFLAAVSPAASALSRAFAPPVPPPKPLPA